MPSNILRCRAKINPDCYDGKHTLRQFGYDAHMSEDGTYDQKSDTVVCDPCYVHLMPFTASGRGLREELVGERLQQVLQMARNAKRR